MNVSVNLRWYWRSATFFRCLRSIEPILFIGGAIGPMLKKVKGKGVIDTQIDGLAQKFDIHSSGEEGSLLFFALNHRNTLMKRELAFSFLTNNIN